MLTSKLNCERLELSVFCIFCEQIASEGLKHRVFEVSLADLQKDEDHAYRKIRLRAEDVQGRNVLTNFWVSSYMWIEVVCCEIRLCCFSFQCEDGMCLFSILKIYREWTSPLTS